MQLLHMLWVKQVYGVKRQPNGIDPYLLATLLRLDTRLQAYSNKVLRPGSSLAVANLHALLVALACVTNSSSMSSLILATRPGSKTSNPPDPSEAEVPAGGGVDGAGVEGLGVGGTPSDTDGGALEGLPILSALTSELKRARPNAVWDTPSNLYARQDGVGPNFNTFCKVL